MLCPSWANRLSPCGIAMDPDRIRTDDYIYEKNDVLYPLSYGVQSGYRAG